MIKNPSYVYGAVNVNVPANLNFGEFAIKRIWDHRDKIALINGETDEKIYYGSIAQHSMNLAVSLTRMGVGRGQTVGILSENNVDFWSAVIGSACTGACVSPINIGYAKGELKHALNISKPKHIICSQFAYNKHEKFLKSLDFLKNIIVFGNQISNTKSGAKKVIAYQDLINAKDRMDVSFENFKCADVVGQSDTLFIMYSSGTTGLPKGVMLSHLNVIAQCFIIPVDPRQISLTIVPWFHAFGLVGNLISFTNGRQNCVFLSRFDVELYLKTIEKHKVTSLTMVPPVLVAVSKSDLKYDLSSVQNISCGAAPLHKDSIDDALKKFPVAKGVHQGYGMTECTLSMTMSHPDMRGVVKTGAVGYVVQNTTVKILDLKTRKPLGPNQPGEICVKGVSVMKGYIGKERKEDFDDEGFYLTGDVGYYDDDQCFFIVDRLKELIKYKGYQVAPAEIEAVLLQHDGVRDAGVIGIESRSTGEVPLGFVVRKPGARVSEKEIQDFVAERLSNPKHLRGGVRFVDAIPKNPSGKILRKDLRVMAKSSKSKL